MALFRLEIKAKANEFDPVSKAVLGEIKNDLQISSISGLAVTEFFDMQLNEPTEKILQLAAQVFTDPITQGFSLNTPLKASNDFAVEVKLLPGITDNTAIIAKKATQDFLGRKLSDEEKISYGKKYLFQGTPSEQELLTICTKLLSNPQIETFKVEKNGAEK